MSMKSKTGTKQTRRKVNVEQADIKPSASHVSLTSRFSARLSYHEILYRELMKAQNLRAQFKVYDRIHGELVDVTPYLIITSYERQPQYFCEGKFTGAQRSGFETISQSSIARSKSTRVIGVKISIEDIIFGIGSDRMLLGDTIGVSDYLDVSSSEESIFVSLHQHNLPFIRVNLIKSQLIKLYEQHSVTVIKNSDDGSLVEKDNRDYDYLTIGRGKIRRRSNAEAQTNKVLLKSRATNTYRIETANTGSYVSFFEMFDTYRSLNKIIHKESEFDLQQTIQESPETNQFKSIKRMTNFHLAAMITKRLLASNCYEEEQKRFRNMNSIDRTVDKINYKYTLRELFIIKPSLFDNERRGTSDISFCCNNGDILAVAYGVYSYAAAKLPSCGEVCVWSIKNPCDPERYYRYDNPVVSLEFSPYMPTLLAIGLFDGTVEVRDITIFNEPPIAISLRKTSPGVDAVLSIKWIRQNKSADSMEVDPILTISQDGSVSRYNIINSPYLAGFKQIILERVEGTPEGLQFKSSNEIEHQANRRPQGLNLTTHPVQHDIFYALTDEGCLHKCSTNYQNQYLELLKTHEGGVNNMDFSPWSPKLFLTCGNDWCIRIWMDGIFKPLLTLKNIYAPYQWAAWSPTHSTIIVGLTRKYIEIWDIRRNILKPMSCKNLENSFNTMAKFSRDGTCIAIGNERGNVHVCALDEMPFPPYFQYEALEQSIHKAVATNADLLIELKSVGYFGYPNKNAKLN